MSRSVTLRGLVLATVSAAALSSCGSHPGAAAVVGPETISDTRLDDVALALCAAQTASAEAAQQQQELASRAARQAALGVLVNDALTRQYAETRGVEPDQRQVNAALAANEATIEALPASRRAVFRETLTEAVEAQSVLLQIGRAQLARAGTASPTDQQAFTVASRLRDRWAARNADVVVDPRYGSFTDGALAAGTGSLSVPVSSEAVAGAEATPDASWTSSLPANQKCG